jgi:hypothetical protein
MSNLSKHFNAQTWWFLEKLKEPPNIDNNLAKKINSCDTHQVYKKNNILKK